MEREKGGKTRGKVILGEGGGGVVCDSALLKLSSHPSRLG